jgi:hypothetical protein
MLAKVVIVLVNIIVAALLLAWGSRAELGDVKGRLKVYISTTDLIAR